MKTRRWVAGLAGSTLVLAGAVGSGGLTAASATAPNGPGTVLGAGDLYLSTITLPTTVTYVPASGTGSSETITVAKGTKCQLATGGTTYLTFGSSAGGGAASVPGYATKSQNGAQVGVQSGNENGLACSQVNDTAQETLTLQLNNQGTTSPFTAPLGFGNVRGTSADIDVNLAGNAIINADLYRGTQRVGGAQLQSGFSLVKPVPNNDQLYVCSGSSNSGPQSVSNNNCYWNIGQLVYGGPGITNEPTQAAGSGYGNGVDPSITSDPGPGGLDWDRIVLTAVYGSFSVQGGGQWPATLQSQRQTHIALEAASDGTLDCGQTAESTSTGGNVTQVQITRLDNGSPQQACTAVNYTLGTSNGTATFHKPLAGQDSAQFEVAFTRTLTPNSSGVVTYPIPALKIDWEDGGGAHTLTSCPTSVYSNQTGTAAFTWPGNPSPLDMSTGSSGLPGTQYACQYGESQVENSDGSVTVTDQVYLTGDAKFLT